MYSVLKAMPAHDAMRAAVTFGLAMIVAELLYAFGSFALECIAFVATWLVLDALAKQILPKPRERAADRR